EFCRMVIRRGHLSVLEHESISVRFVIDRGVSHELVRHRLAAYSQESTRYCDYAGGVKFVIPPWIGLEAGHYERGANDRYPGVWDIGRDGANWQCGFASLPIDTRVWMFAMWSAEESYTSLRSASQWTPQQARSVLPNSLKTEIVMTANLREWRHVFSLRCAPSAHPQMREIMGPLLTSLRRQIPVIFDDLLGDKQQPKEVQDDGTKTESGGV
ncbi:hypothetical protein LCGC14_2026500, partial [marine sediment metagenome]